jgi:serine protease Do
MGDALDGGAQVMALVPEGPAARAGVQVGDVFVSLDGREVEGRRELTKVLRTLRPEQPVELAVLRDREVRRVRLTPTVRPEERVRVVVERPRPAPTLAPRLRMAVPGLRGLSVVAIPEELRVHYGAPADAGVLVSAVVEGSAAAAAGLQVGDVVVRAGGEAVESPSDLGSRVALSLRDEELPLELIRDRRSVRITVELKGQPLLDPRAAERTSAYVQRALEAREAATDERVRMLEEEIRVLREQIRRLEEELREEREGP